MKLNFLRAAPLFAGLLCANPPQTEAQIVSSALCENGECQPVVSAVDYGGRAAYKLTDGKTEAVIVPQIGRVMSFGKVGGPNLLWNAAQTSKNADWKNYGGDKTWLAPQSSWPTFHGAAWPPDPALDGLPHRAEVLSGGKVRLISPLSASGIRLTRTMFFDANGEFVIEQTARKEKGAPVRASIWSITQIVPGEAIYLPAASNSAYKDGFHKFSDFKGFQPARVVSSNMLAVKPNLEGSSKFGVDSQVSSVVSVREGVAFLQKSTRPAGDYPDGKDGAGFPVEVFVNGDAKNFYAELELLGPLKTFSIGGKSTQTVRWSLHKLGQEVSKDDQSIEKLLYGQ